MTFARAVRRGLVVSSLATGCAAARDATSPEPVVIVRAHRFEYSPARIVVRAAVPTTLELASFDVVHGFSIPALGVRADVVPGHPTRVHVLAERAGTFAFHCDVFCGDGHEEMTGVLEVTP